MVDAALAARRLPVGALHVAAPDRSRRAVRRRRPAGRRRRRCAAPPPTCAPRSRRFARRARCRRRRPFSKSTTALAFELFRRAGVEVAVVEVGLGGRLDATNVIRPVATAITSIGFDHQQYLGLDAGARLRRRRPASSSRACRSSSATSVPEACGGHRAHRRRAGRRADPGARRRAKLHRRAGAAATSFALRTPVRDYGAVKLALPRRPSDRQCRRRGPAARDARRARHGRVARRDRRALAHVSWPGRLERRSCRDGRELILDAAHNPAGAAALAAYLASLGGTPPPLVFAAMRDKDAADAAACCCRRSAADLSRARRTRAPPIRSARRRGARDRAGARRSRRAVSGEALATAWRCRRASSSPDRSFCSATS